MYYFGVFFDQGANVRLFDPNNCGKLLDNKIEDTHVTFAFNPSEEDRLPKNLRNQKINVTVVGIGNDGNNHGYKVELPEEVKDLLYKNPAVPHITLSLAPGAKAKDTKNLDFKAIKPFTVIGSLDYRTH